MSNLVDRYDRNSVITEEIIINEWESCKFVKECLPDLQCVYAVSVNRRVVYIGSTISLNNRLWLYLNDNPISRIFRNKQCPTYQAYRSMGMRECLRLGLYDIYNLVVHYKIWNGYVKERFKLEYQLIETIKPVLNVAGAYRERNYDGVEQFFKTFNSIHPR